MSGKFIEQRLFIHLDRPDGVVRVGEVEFDESAPGGFAAKFKYDEGWIRSPNGFALDPINLPLRPGYFDTDSKYVKLGVLMDAGPDMWGRRVYAATTGTGGFLQTEKDLLLHGRGNGVGALFFSTSPDLLRQDIPGLETLPVIESDLERAHEAVHHVIAKDPMGEGFDDLLAGSWSIGGARAKAVMRSFDNRLWIVKFSQPEDPIDRIRAEHANLKMAQAIGLRVPKAEIIQTRLGSALLVERFDRTASLSRLHYVSAMSLVSAEPENKRLISQRDQAIFSYANLASVIRKVSPDPVREQKELFAQMVLNICVHNTDDHLKNFGFVESELAGPKYLSLSKVFDVVTNTSRQHYLRIGSNGREGTIANALSEPRRFGLTDKGAADIVAHVVEIVANRQAFYEASGLSTVDQDHLESIVSTRCPKTNQNADVGYDTPGTSAPGFGA